MLITCDGGRVGAFEAALLVYLTLLFGELGGGFSKLFFSLAWLYLFFSSLRAWKWHSVQIAWMGVHAEIGLEAFGTEKLLFGVDCYWFPISRLCSAPELMEEPWQSGGSHVNPHLDVHIERLFPARFNVRRAGHAMMKCHPGRRFLEASMFDGMGWPRHSRRRLFICDITD